MNKSDRIEKLKEISTYVRTTALDVIMKANNGHIGGNMSSVELLTTLYYGGQFHFDDLNDKNENRDRVLIRGHEGPLRYTIFSLLGYIEPEELLTYRTLGSRLQGHEDMDITPGVDITPSGSLGMLLSYGVGSCIANKDKKINSKTIVFLGDGEEQEGNISEAARHASKLGLDNLICILDKNTKQIIGGPEIITRGFIYVKESQDLLEETKQVSREVIEASIEVNAKRVDYARIKNDVRDILGKFFYRETGAKPMIITVIQEI